MTATASTANAPPPKDVVAVFHVSFHSTKGNTIDWSKKVSDDISLDGLEFSALPSGLHTQEEDVVYVSTSGHHGVCVFTRRATDADGQRGFRQSSLGILVARSPRPRPWRHIPALKELASSLGAGEHPASWKPVEDLFESRQHTDAAAGSNEAETSWSGWTDELAEGGSDDPALNLPMLLLLLGPSSLTLYKHVLGNRRVLFYCKPPVQTACNFARAAADICFGFDVTSGQGRPDVLGLITLGDIPRLQQMKPSEGWIAATTDALFLERPQFYDLLIDLSSSSKDIDGMRPTLSISRRLSTGSSSSKTPPYRLQTVRFTWSDIRLWNRLSQFLDKAKPGEEARSGSWTAGWSRAYEDACLYAAGAVSSGMRRARGDPLSEGLRLQGEDDILLRPTPVSTPPRAIPRWSASSGSKKTLSKGKGLTAAAASSSSGALLADISTSETASMSFEQDPRTSTTVQLLHVFDAHSATLLSRLDVLIAQWADASGSISPSSPSSSADRSHTPLSVTPRDVSIIMGLGAMSGLDARFVEWLGHRIGRPLEIRPRGWRDVVGAALAMCGL